MTEAPISYNTVPGEEDLRGPRFSETLANLAAVWNAELSPRDQVARGISWAIHCHRDQRDRPDGAPYLQRVSSVAKRVIGWAPHPTGTLAAAALLHDAVEDQPVRLVQQVGAQTLGSDPAENRRLALSAIEEVIGGGVAELVEKLTNPFFMDDIESNHSFPPDSAAYDAIFTARYLEHFVDVIMGNEDAALIKLADFADNALRLDFVKRETPGRYPWLVRKYGPCVAFLRELLPALPPGSPLRRAWKTLRGDIEMAWLRDFSPRP